MFILCLNICQKKYIQYAFLHKIMTIIVLPRNEPTRNRDAKILKSNLPANILHYALILSTSLNILGHKRRKHKSTSKCKGEYMKLK